MRVDDKLLRPGDTHTAVVGDTLWLLASLEQRSLPFELEFVQPAPAPANEAGGSALKRSAAAAPGEPPPSKKAKAKAKAKAK